MDARLILTEDRKRAIINAAKVLQYMVTLHQGTLIRGTATSLQWAQIDEKCDDLVFELMEALAGKSDA